jgi:hypothetical protein
MGKQRTEMKWKWITIYLRKKQRMEEKKKNQTLIEN